MSKEVRFSVVPYEQYSEEDFNEPTKYFCVGATGDRYYFHTRDRAKAQAQCDEDFGKGKYKIRTGGIEKSDTITCRGSMNSKSYAGQKLISIRNSQGRGL